MEGVVDWFPGRASAEAQTAGGEETLFQITREAGGYCLSQGGRERLVTVRAPLCRGAGGVDAAQAAARYLPHAALPDARPGGGAARPGRPGGQGR